MKRSFTAFVAAGVLVLASLIVTTDFAPIRSVHAQTGCDLTSLNGAFGYNLTGYAYDNQGNLYLLTTVGRIVADGAGGLTGADTYSFDGTIAKRTYTGTYTMNADCTGSTTLQYTVGTSTGTEHGNIVSVNNGREVDYIQTDGNYVLSGAFKKQVQ